MPNENLFWYRIEPRQRGDADAEEKASRPDSIEQNLAAQIHDPLWFLARQWQFGEFQGEDAASPTYVELKARFSSIDGWRPTGAQNYQKYNIGEAPLEARVTAEPFSPDDWATAVELGQRFESLLKDENLQHLISSFREKYAVPSPEDDNMAENDLELKSFLLVCAGRAINGVKLYRHVRDESSELREFLDGLPNSPENRQTLSPENRGTLDEMLRTFRNWVNAVFGDFKKAFGDFEEAKLQNFSKEDPLAWRPERLEYGVEVSASKYDKPSKQSQRVRFEAYPGRDGAFDWYAFDQKSVQPEGHNVKPFLSGGLEYKGDLAARELSFRVETVRVSPTYVKLSGMPNKRWWQFENRRVNLPSLEPDLVEQAKVILVDFMLVYSNDWFVVPFAQQVGTLCQVDSLEVYDVFGKVTSVERAEDIDRNTQGEQYDKLRPSERWSMFSITAGHAGELADFFILPPSAATTTFTSDPVEEIRFIRDEMANMVWAIEHITENGIGRPWQGDERTLSRQIEPGKAATSAQGAPLKYQLQTTVPKHWIPFLPVHIDEAKRDIALERAAMRDEDRKPIAPVGRVLNPTKTRLNSPIHNWNGKKVYRIREEEVPRTGVIVSRVIRRSRWIDGSTHLWVARREGPGAGEGSSGLRFDIAVPTQARDRSE